MQFRWEGFRVFLGRNCKKGQATEDGVRHGGVYIRT